MTAAQSQSPQATTLALRAAALAIWGIPAVAGILCKTDCLAPAVTAALVVVGMTGVLAVVISGRPGADAEHG